MVFGIQEELATLHILARDGKQSGPDLRSALNSELCKSDTIANLACFYHMMYRFEDRGEVRGWTETVEIQRQNLRIRWYEITQDGYRSLDEKQMQEVQVPKLAWA